MTSQSPPLPVHDPIATPPRRDLRPGERDETAGLITEPWVRALQFQSEAIQAAPARVATAQLTGQTASIGTTVLSTDPTATGLYRITYYFRITTPGSTSSSLSCTFSWTDDGVPVSATTAAVTGNTTTSFSSGSLLVSGDQASSVSYATTYASVGATPMEYKLSVILEAINA